MGHSMSISDATRFTRVDFLRFKAFKRFSLQLRHFNILVGPNNAGKSTVLAAFRILAAGMRRANSRKPEIVRGPLGMTHGYRIDLGSISIAEENLFFNYDDSEAATVSFKLSNSNELLLYFPEQNSCYLIAQSKGKSSFTPTTFKSNFNCRIGSVPILGPLEHNETLSEPETARSALYNYRATRNFRNIWHHFPEKFEEFRSALVRTWPGMDIEPPVIDRSYGKPRLHMFCPEERIPREIFWAGFGFQVWCQMLTNIIQSRDTALFLIDEPDIYLHSELQRQLIGLLRDMGPDVLIATHSTEIITEAETDDLVLISKHRTSGRRIKQPSQLEEVFSILGSNLNPVLTQLAKSRRVVFVEGQDFQLLSKFAMKLNYPAIGNRSQFAVVPIEGFNPERIRNLKNGMETTLGGKILAAAILDKDYRSEAEREAIAQDCRAFCTFVAIHHCKEIENFVLVPDAIDRAADRRIADRTRRSGRVATKPFVPFAQEVLEEFAQHKKSYVQAQYLTKRRAFERGRASIINETTFSEVVLNEFEELWNSSGIRLRIIPGKDALAIVNRYLQEEFGVSVTATSIVEAMRVEEVPSEMSALLGELSLFSFRAPVDRSS
uniref:ATPase AAA-type core domain-containing protein n=1 Tax=Rhodopseudomonas palustris (strain BisA53) TaxID=316055 RepID=Q07MU5_RHOP5